MLLPFKEAMQQVEGENIVTRSCIYRVVVGLMKALEQPKNSNLSYCKNLAKTLQDSVSKRLLLFLNFIDNRLASLLDPRFKDKWIKNDVQKKEAMRLLQVHVTSRLGQCKEDSTGTDDENEILVKNPRLFVCIAADSKKRKPSTVIQ